MFDPKITELKPMEGQLLSMLARGYNAQRIANELHISANYAYFLMRELRQRFLVLSNPELISRAIAEGIILPDGNLTNTCVENTPVHGANYEDTDVVIVIYIIRRPA